MCLAIPARIISINGYNAEVDIGGVRRTVSLLFVPEAKVGDYVYVHTGYAISVLDEEQAHETLRLLEEMFEQYGDELFVTMEAGGARG
ncbi:MAG: hypothetical protein DRI61_10270 [Chloroflexi bacterium]|nr:MAG: hypothetical protein DRI61_10270 [Chloroflexota bacterium]HDN78833.1 HypC/HybG/HupF family hydrogenase formation chaperone [Chloroflexota bacterium]